LVRLAIAAGLVLTPFVGCGDDEESTPVNPTTSVSSAGGSVEEPLCTKYGGKASVATMVRDRIIPAVAADCRINAFFAGLSEPELEHVQDCLVIQMQQYFGCPGSSYAGSMDSNGQSCRSMREAHLGLSISAGDMEAFLEDVASALTLAGVDAEDIAEVAAILTPLETDIVEQAELSTPSQDMCLGGGGMGGAGGAGGAGGNLGGGGEGGT
jgi:hemoglobin